MQYARWAWMGLVVTIISVSLAPICLGQEYRKGDEVIVRRDVLEMKTFPNPTGELRREQALAAQQSLPRDMQTPSRLRKVSLIPLEDAIRENHGAISEEMKNLAGLVGIRYVLFYPESKHIVIAGPAEGWMRDPTGRTIGLTSGQPTVQLQDLVTALRAFPPGKDPTEKIGCSIDPTAEGLAALQRYLKSIQDRVVAPGTEQAFAAEVQAGLRKSLGLCRIEVFGVPSTTHFARVIVEADYRMKLIGMGLEEPPVKIVSFVQHPDIWKFNPRNVSRWYLVPEYQCVRVAKDKDKLAMELVGDGVRLIGKEWDTERQLSLATLSKANEAFVTSFTENYSELAQRSPVYADFRNMIHLAVAAAFIQKQEYYRKAGWSMEFLSSEESFPVQTYNPPQAVASVVAAISNGRRLMTPTGGGVQIEPGKVLSEQNLLPDENAELGKLRTKLEPPKGKWWWD